jgi:hypothetical protein
VPYVGAVTTVDLGAQTIQAGSFVKAGGTAAQFLKANGSVDSNTYLTTGSAAATYVPYTGAITDVNLGANSLAAEAGFFDNNGSSDTLTVTHTSGSGYGIIVTKGGNNEALYVEKTSGSGNAMRVLGGRTSLVDLALSSVTNTAGDFLTISGGVVHKRTSAEVRTDIGAGTGNGTVTSVAALTLGTSGTDLSSTVANGTTTPVITLNVPTASASNRGALSSADWTTFNSKQNALTNPVTGTGTTNTLPKFTDSTTIGNSALQEVSGNLGLGVSPSNWSNLKVLQVGSTSLGGFSNTGYVNANAFFNTSTNWTYINSSFAARYELNSGDAGVHRWYTAPSGTAGSSISFTEAMTLTASSQLGINNPTPTAQLHLRSGGSYVNTDSNNRIIVERDAHTYLMFISPNEFDQGIHFAKNTGIVGRIAYHQRAAGDFISFTVESAIRMQLFNTGNLYVGPSPSDSGFRLDINGTSRFQGISTFTGTTVAANGSINIDSPDPAIRFRYTGGTANARIYEWRGIAAGGVNDVMELRLWNDAQTSTTRLFTVSPTGTGIFTGNLGLGVTPAAWSGFKAINIFGGSFSTNSSVGGGVVIARNWYFDGGERYFENGTAQRLEQVSNRFVFQTAANNSSGAGAALTWNSQMTLFETGNLTVGSTADAGFKLDVQGTGRFSGNLTAASIIRNGGTSSQFLKADGSVDSNTYVTLDTAQTITAKKTFTTVNYTTFTNNDFFQVEFSNGSSKLNLGSASNTGYIASNGELRFATNYPDDSLINPKLIIATNGNVGINTASPSTKLHVSNNTVISDALGLLYVENTNGSSGASSTNSAVNVKNMHGTSQFMQWQSNGLRFGSRIVTSGGVGDVFITSGADNVAMILKAGGNVLIGTTTDSGQRLQVSGSSRFSGELIQGGGTGRSTNGSTIAFTGSSQTIYSSNSDSGDGGRFLSIVNENTSTNAFSGLSFRVNPNGGSNNAMLDMKFVNSNSNNSSTLYWTFLSGGSFFDRMALTSGGNLLIGTTTLIGPVQGRLDVQYDGLTHYGMNIRTTHTDGVAISFNNSSGTQVGRITTNSSSTSYITSSDYRLKRDLKDFNGLDLINKIKTYDFEWKTDKSRSYGVVAHELQEVINYAVHGQKDLDIMQGVDYTKLVPILIKAIQEQQVQIDKLKN